MSIYDERFCFRLATTAEIDRIMRFIRDYWGNPEHILATDREFFKYEFQYGETIGFYLAIDKKNDDIAAIMAAYSYGREFCVGESCMSSGMFLANPNCQVPMIGFEMLRRFLAEFRPRSYVSPGVNMRTSAPLIRRISGNTVERMKHFYILSDRETYVVADIHEKKPVVIDRSCEKKLVLYENADRMYRDFDDESFKMRKPYKDRWFVEKRYFHHPVYDYLVWGVEDRMAIVGREVSYNGVKVLRIVDILGEVGLIGTVGSALVALMDENGYEYIDLYEQKVRDEDLKKAGFIERTKGDENIIPNYFEPFEKKNIEIYAHRIDDDSYCFKADGDQDRPNRV